MTYFILKKVDIFYDKWLEVIYGVKDCYIQQQDYQRFSASKVLHVGQAGRQLRQKHTMFRSVSHKHPELISNISKS